MLAKVAIGCTAMTGFAVGSRLDARIAPETGRNLAVLAQEARGLGDAWRVAGVTEAAGVAVELSVLKANPAQRLYACLGFRPVGEAARAYTLRWTPPRAAKA